VLPLCGEFFVRSTLAVLWRLPTTPRRGPRPGLSVDAVVDAAIGLADGEGLDAVTMRRVAQLVGVAPMTLYTYVPGKAELLDVMLDSPLLARVLDPSAYPTATRVGTAADHAWDFGLTTLLDGLAGLPGRLG
jgi:AcrR family transcriptional regulator